MKTPDLPQIERNVARCRIILSVSAILAVFVDPTEPVLRSGAGDRSNWFTIDLPIILVMGTHFLYSTFTYVAVTRALIPRRALTSLTTWGDILIGAGIAFVTEGVSSPFYAFFVFAVVQVGIRAGFRQAIAATALSVGLYLSLILVSQPGWLNFYIMRPVYLAIIGYLVADLAQQRRNLETNLQTVAAAEQRDQIARDLHDDWAQAFAGIDLSLESCLQLLQMDRTHEASAQLKELQLNVRREFDQLRTYTRSLAGIPSIANAGAAAKATHFSLRTDISGSGPFLDHVLQVLREGISNISRHAEAESATLAAHTSQQRLALTIDDDGRGSLGDAQYPWSIASRVRQMGGELTVVRDGRAGVHLSIQSPQG